MATILFRPVGLHELALIWDSGMCEFPPRLPHQPIFYPVANIEYAIQIAKDWNTKESRFAGYVTKFAVADSYLAGFESHTVGSAKHVEYWIPAEEIHEFNASVEGRISVEAGFFGSSFKGFVPDSFGLKGKDAIEQFVINGEDMGLQPNGFCLRGFDESQSVLLKFPLLGRLRLQRPRY